jgi:drug/metabolite transporter (DMT)-like permease
MSRRALLLFAAMCLIWGIPYLFIRIAVSEVSPEVLVFARTGAGALILLPIAIARGELRGVAARWLPFLGFAALEIGLPWLMLSSAEQRISSSLAGLLIAAVPLVGVVVAPLFGNRDRMDGLNLSGLLIGLLGVAAIVGFDFHVSDWVALVQMALVVIGYAVGPAILNRYLKELPSVGVTAAALAVCAVAYLPLAILRWPHSVPSASVLGSVAVLALVCTVLGFLLFFALIGEIGPVRATVITYINPAVAAVLGIIVLREHFTLGMAAGFVLVLIGSTLSTRKRRTEVRAAALPVALDDQHVAARPDA